MTSSGGLHLCRCGEYLFESEKKTHHCTGYRYGTEDRLSEVQAGFETFEAWPVIYAELADTAAEKAAEQIDWEGADYLYASGGLDTLILVDESNNVRTFKISAKAVVVYNANEIIVKEGIDGNN